MWKQIVKKAILQMPMAYNRYFRYVMPLFTLWSKISIRSFWSIYWLYSSVPFHQLERNCYENYSSLSTMGFTSEREKFKIFMCSSLEIPKRLHIFCICVWICVFQKRGQNHGILYSNSKKWPLVQKVSLFSAQKETISWQRKWLFWK